jgi:uncharacterized protein
VPKIRAVIVVVACGILLYVGLALPKPTNYIIAKVGDKKIHLLQTFSRQDRVIGLSERHSIAANEGMLFSFNKKESSCLWMKDMEFSIDIIWLDSSKQIIDLAEYVSPKTYPKSFCPITPAAYALELPAGTIRRSNIQTGTPVNF